MKGQESHAAFMPCSQDSKNEENGKFVWSKFPAKTKQTKHVLKMPNDSPTNTVWFANTKHCQHTNAFCFAIAKLSNKYTTYLQHIMLQKQILQVQKNILKDKKINKSHDFWHSLSAVIIRIFSQIS